MAIVIKSRKVVVEGWFRREIIEVNAVGKEKLPRRYTDTYPNCRLCFTVGVKSLKLTTGLGEFYLYPGGIFMEEYYQAFVSELYHCGDRLHDINLKIKRLPSEAEVRLERVWTGEETLRI